MALSSTSKLAALFPREDELRCDLAALSAHLLLLTAFALLCAGILSPAVFMVVGLCAYVRNFNALHEGSHARRSAWNPLRKLNMLVMIVHSPFQLGYRELARNHRLHHAYPRDLDHDPDASLNSGHWYRAAPNASVQPELSAVQYLRRVGKLDAGLRWGFVYNCAMISALVALGGANIVWWIAATRLGSTATWFIFDWILHHPRVYDGPEPRPVFRRIGWLWSLMFSRANFNATRFHALHHRFPAVADNSLPALARLLAERARGDVHRAAA